MLPMYFSDLHVDTLSRAILQPGEQLLGQTVTSYLPWWALGFINRQYLVLATNQRLIMVEHRMGFFPVGYRMHVVDSLAWPNVQEAKVKGFLKKKLSVRGTGDRGPVKIKMVIPNALFGLLAPMKNNMLGARAVAAAHQNAAQGGSLPPAPFAQVLPPASFAPQQQQMQPAYGQPPPPAAFGPPRSY